LYEIMLAGLYTYRFPADVPSVFFMSISLHI
jgi:hypothetical protein